MRRFIRFARLGAIGTFFTGALLVIQGCDAREATLLFFALFALNFCSGPVVSDDTSSAPPFPVCASGATAACAIDQYTDAASLLNVCGAGANADTVPAPGTIMNSRRIDFGASNASNASVVISGGGITYANPTATSCLNGVSVYPATGVSPTDIDLSAFSQITYTVSSVTGTPPTDCRIDFEQSTPPYFLIPITTPYTEGTHVISLPSTNEVGYPAQYAHVHRIRIGVGCAPFPANATWTMSPFVLLP